MRETSARGGIIGVMPRLRSSSSIAAIGKTARFENVPDVGGDRTAGLHDMFHIGDALRRIGNEEDQGHDCRVEPVIRTWQRHRIALLEAREIRRNATARIVELTRGRIYSDYPSEAQRRANISVKAPLPQPISNQRQPVSGDSHSRNTSPTSELQTPIMRS